jgi:protein phosphatase
VLLADGDAAVAHVGDSRLYVWRGGRLSLVTADHSLVGEQLRAGMIDEAQARRHPWRHVVTRSLSGQPDLQVDITSYGVESGDRLLLCSDGLSGVVDDETMAAILARDETASARCHALVDAANAAGGPDNITAIVVDVA